LLPFWVNPMYLQWLSHPRRLPRETILLRIDGDMHPHMLIEFRPIPVKLWLIIIRVVVDYTIMIRRHITDLLLEALADTPVVLVNGTR